LEFQCHIPNHVAFTVAAGRCVLGPEIGLIKIEARDARIYEIKVDVNRIEVDIQG
jgi:hypothetical protein